MTPLGRTVSVLALAGALAGCVVYPDGGVGPAPLIPPPPPVTIGIGPGWGGGYYAPGAWGGYQRPWGGYYRPWGGGGYYRPYSYYGWRRW